MNKINIFMQKFIERIFLLALLIMPWTSWSQANSVLSCDFENVATDADWTLVNGDQTNGWAIGTAAHYGNGSRGLYISSDNGVTYGYSEVMAADAYVYQQLQLDAGMYQYSYDWTCTGETTLDCFRVLLVPAAAELTAGQIFPGLSGDSTPAGWLALDTNIFRNYITSTFDESVSTCSQSQADRSTRRCTE